MDQGARKSDSVWILHCVADVPLVFGYANSGFYVYFGGDITCVEMLRFLHVSMFSRTGRFLPDGFVL